MEFKKDDRVKHPNKPEWGLGKVLEDSANGKARVFFKGAGEKIISVVPKFRRDSVITAASLAL